MQTWSGAQKKENKQLSSNQIHNQKSYSIGEKDTITLIIYPQMPQIYPQIICW